MTRFFGKVGYAIAVREDGVSENIIVEHEYYGEELRNVRDFSQGDSVQGEVKYQTRISIVADAFALANFEDIRYVEWMGAPRIVTDVESKRPRLILSFGEKWTGERPEVSDD